MAGSSPESTVAVRSFEGLLLLGCERDPEILAAAKQLGIDFDSDRTWYSPETWRQAIELVRVHRFGALPVEEGLDRVGQLFVRGYIRTFVGSVYDGMIRRLGPDRALARAPEYFASGRSDLKIRFEGVAPGSWRMHVEDSFPMPSFSRGILKAILEIAGATGEYELLESRPTGYVLSVRWTPVSR